MSEASKKVTAGESLEHIAIIMDGNGRWASQRGLQPLAGHQAGAERLEEAIRVCREQAVRYLTVFAFSSENWNRPAKEVGGLMSLLASALKRNRKRLRDEGIRLRVIGRRDRLSERLRELIREVELDTAEGTAQLTLAVDYGGRWDIVEATRSLAIQARDGELDPASIDESLISGQLSLADLPDPDLLIRTGFEHRLSNFLLWQISYTEFYFANCFWPDFDRRWLLKAIESYHQRERRFGYASEHRDDSPARVAQSA